MSSIIACGSNELVVFMLHVKRSDRGLSSDLFVRVRVCACVHVRACVCVHVDVYVDVCVCIVCVCVCELLA